MNNKTSIRTFSALAAMAAVFGIAVALNAILARVPWRADLTEEKIYTLSDGTKDLLARLPRPVTLKFFFSDSDPNVDVVMKNFAGRVRDLLRIYAVASKGNVTVEFYNPEPDSDAEDWAQRYGVQGQVTDLGGPAIYIGLVAISGDAEGLLPVIDPRREGLLEYDITRLIARTTFPEKPVIGLVSGLPVLGSRQPPFMMGMQPSSQPPWMSFNELQEDYQLRELSLATGVPDDVKALILMQPKNLSDKDLFAIDQFVLRGGRLIACIDPMCLVESMSGMRPPMGPEEDNLGKLLTAWGVEYDAQRVVVDPDNATAIQDRNGQPEENPSWLSLRKDAMARNDNLSANLSSLLLVGAGSFRVTTNATATVVPLVTASRNAGSIMTMAARGDGATLMRRYEKSKEPVHLALRLKGKFRTAFPNGDPEPAQNPGTTAESGEKPAATPAEKQTPPASAALKESAQEGSVILIGDADWLFDALCVQQRNFLGFRTYQPMNDNLALFSGAVEQAAGLADLSAIRGRSKTNRPFDVVLDIQRTAQERYLAEATALEDKLQQLEQELNNLQANKSKDQTLVLSADQRAAIENFRKDQLQTRQQLREVRRELRKDIERLGFKIKTINILLMPLLVAIGGVLFAVYRRQRTSRKEG